MTRSVPRHVQSTGSRRVHNRFQTNAGVPRYPTRAVFRPIQRFPGQADTAGTVQEAAVRSAAERQEERLARFAARIGADNQDIAALAPSLLDGRDPCQTLRLGATRHRLDLAQRLLICHLQKTMVLFRQSAHHPLYPQDSDQIRLEQVLAKRLGMPVTIRYDTMGRGQIVIDFANLDIITLGKPPALPG